MSGTILLDKNLRSRKCAPPQKGDRPLGVSLVKGYLSGLSGWKRSGKEIMKLFRFGDFHETIDFVNALAYIANREDHHPDLEVGYKTCKVHYSSHELGGLSENDFICAAKIDALIDGE